MQRVLSCRTSTQVKEQTVRMGRGPVRFPTPVLLGQINEISDESLTSARLRLK
jgi:hypothetical protein